MVYKFNKLQESLKFPCGIGYSEIVTIGTNIATHQEWCYVFILPSALTISGPCLQMEALGKLASARTVRESSGHQPVAIWEHFWLSYTAQIQQSLSGGWTQFSIGDQWGLINYHNGEKFTFLYQNLLFMCTKAFWGCGHQQFYSKVTSHGTKSDT